MQKTHSSGWRRKWWLSHCPWTMSLHPCSSTCLRVILSYQFGKPNQIEEGSWSGEPSLDWTIGCYSGTKGSQTGRGMHLFREEEAGLLGTLKKEKSAACCGVLRIHRLLQFRVLVIHPNWDRGVFLSLKCYKCYLSLDTGVKAAFYGLWIITCQHFLCHSHFQTLTVHIPFFQLQHCCLKSI